MSHSEHSKNPPALCVFRVAGRFWPVLIARLSVILFTFSPHQDCTPLNASLLSRYLYIHHLASLPHVPASLLIPLPPSSLFVRLHQRKRSESFLLLWIKGNLIGVSRNQSHSVHCKIVKPSYLFLFQKHH